MTPEPPPVDAIETPAAVFVTVTFDPADIAVWNTDAAAEVIRTSDARTPATIWVEAEIFPEVKAVPFGNVIEEVPTIVISVFVNVMLDAFVNTCWPTFPNVTADEK